MDTQLERELTPIAKLIHENTAVTKDTAWERLPWETRAAYLNLASDVDQLYRQRRTQRWTRILRRNR